MVAAKPDCTGERFGLLTVLGKGSRVSYRKNNGKESYCYLWKLQCDCGEIIELRRNYFDRKGQNRYTSCGCKRRRGGSVHIGRKIIDITGKRFGQLVAISLSGDRDKWNKPTWLFQCDCGNICKMSLSAIRRHEYLDLRINCKDWSKHSDRGLNYPATPAPYPKEAGILLEKYLHLTELDYKQVKSEVEDEKRDRLLRAAWILTYRRSQGEQISELYESRFIRKHLRYCSIKVFWRHKLEQHGGLLYNASNEKRQIGGAMTDLTSLDYPVIETSGITILSSDVRPPKRLKFKRC